MTIDILEKLPTTAITKAHETMIVLGQNAREAYAALAVATSQQKEKALLSCAAEIRAAAKKILAGNEKDIAAANLFTATIWL